MYGVSKEEHLKLVTSKDLMTDREVREEMIDLNMPRTVFFSKNTGITEESRQSELKWLISAQQHFKLSNTFLFHSFNCFDELLKTTTLVTESNLKEITKVCAVISNKMTDDENLTLANISGREGLCKVLEGSVLSALKFKVNFTTQLDILLMTLEILVSSKEKEGNYWFNLFLTICVVSIQLVLVFNGVGSGGDVEG